MARKASNAPAATAVPTVEDAVTAALATIPTVTAGFTLDGALADTYARATAMVRKAEAFADADLLDLANAKLADAVQAVTDAHDAYVKSLAKTRATRREEWIDSEPYSDFVSAVTALAAMIPPMVRVAVSYFEDGTVRVHVPDPRAGKLVDAASGPKTHNGGKVLVVTRADGTTHTLIPARNPILAGEYAEQLANGTASIGLANGVCALMETSMTDHPHQNACGVVKRLLASTRAAEWAGWTFKHDGTDCATCQCGQSVRARKA